MKGVLLSNTDAQMKYATLLLASLLIFAGCSKTNELSDSSASSPQPNNNAAAAESSSAESSSAESTNAESTTAETTGSTKSVAMLAFEKLDDEYAEAQDAFYEKVRSLPQNERREFAEKNEPNSDAYVEKFMKIADDHPDDPAAVESLLWVGASRVDEESSKKAIDTLLEKYSDDEKLGRLAFVLMYGEPSDEVEQKMKSMIEKSPHDAVKAKMTFALAEYYKSNMAEIGADEAQVVSLYETLGSKYGDFKIHGQSQQTFGDLAKNSLFEIQNLGVGKIAPDIEGEDLDGVEFKLSEYRGKVVVLDFWGHW